MASVQMTLPLLPVGGTPKFIHEKRTPDGYRPPEPILQYAEYFDEQILRVVLDPHLTNLDQYHATCWTWLGPRDSDWPYLNLNSRKFSAQRFNYLYRVGPVLDELVVKPVCTQRDCVSPFHLEIKSPRSGYKLAPELREQIRQIYWRDSLLNQFAPKTTMAELAARFGVSKGHVQRIVWERDPNARFID
jgi:hypothetical protein